MAHQNKRLLVPLFFFGPSDDIFQIFISIGKINIIIIAFAFTNTMSIVKTHYNKIFLQKSFGKSFDIALIFRGSNAVHNKNKTLWLGIFIQDNRNVFPSPVFNKKLF